jgi:hypothetical protein
MNVHLSKKDKILYSNLRMRWQKMKTALPLLHQQRYESFQQLLEHVNQTIAVPTESAVVLKLRVAELQQFFRDQLLSLQLDELSPALQHWVQSYQVEFDKQLRLLSIDAMSLQAARQPATIVQRQRQVRDRLSTLRQYCEAVLGKGEG